jgi:hypothetical protein
LLGFIFVLVFCSFRLDLVVCMLQCSRIVGFYGFFSLDLLSLKFLVSFIVKRGSLLLLCNPCIYLVTASK